MIETPLLCAMLLTSNVVYTSSSGNIQTFRGTLFDEMEQFETSEESEETQKIIQHYKRLLVAAKDRARQVRDEHNQQLADEGKYDELFYHQVVDHFKRINEKLNA